MVKPEIRVARIWMALHRNRMKIRHPLQTLLIRTSRTILRRTLNQRSPAVLAASQGMLVSLPGMLLARQTQIPIQMRQGNQSLEPAIAGMVAPDSLVILTVTHHRMAASKVAPEGSRNLVLTTKKHYAVCLSNTATAARLNSQRLAQTILRPGIPAKNRILQIKLQTKVPEAAHLPTHRNLARRTRHPMFPMEAL